MSRKGRTWTLRGGAGHEPVAVPESVVAQQGSLLPQLAQAMRRLQLCHLVLVSIRVHALFHRPGPPPACSHGYNESGNALPATLPHSSRQHSGPRSSPVPWASPCMQPQKQQVGQCAACNSATLSSSAFWSTLFSTALSLPPHAATRATSQAMGHLQLCHLVLVIILCPRSSSPP